MAHHVAAGILLVLMASFGVVQTSLSSSPNARQECSGKLETLGRAVAAACATPAVATLPQMALACTLTANLHVALDAETTIRMPPAAGSLGMDMDVAAVAPPALTPASQQHLSSAHLKDNRRTSAASLLHPRAVEKSTRRRRRQRRTAVAADETTCSEDTRDSIQAQCAVRGCTWSSLKADNGDDAPPKHDLRLACDDATAMALPSNYTTNCTYLTQPELQSSSCAVDIQLSVTTAALQRGSLQSAATLLGIWQGKASVTVRGQWDAHSLSVVLQHAHNLKELDAASAWLASLGNSTFAGLSSLEILDLNENVISKIDAGAFAELTALQELYLRDNCLTSLPAQLLQGHPSLQILVLGNNQLKTLSDSPFQGLGNLTWLDLWDNNLTSLSAASFDGLAALEYLDLSFNKLTLLSKGTFEGLSKLTILYLYVNNLTTLDATTFRDLSALEVLELDDNKLVQLPGDVFKGLMSLDRLDLYRNKLTSIDATIFGDLSALRSLDISLNSLASLPTHLLQNVTGLHVFDVDSNHLTDIDTAMFHGLPALQYLDISNNQLTRLPASLLNRTPSLTWLSVAYNKISSIDAAILGNLSALHTLDLSSNRFTHIDEDLLRGLPQLQSFNFGCNKLTRIDSSLLNGLSMLGRLDLSQNQLGNVPDSLFNGLSLLTFLSLDSNKLTSFSNTLLLNLLGLEVLELGGNPLGNLPDGLLNVSLFTSLSRLDLKHTGVVQLQLAANNKLSTLNLHGCRSLTKVILPSRARVSAADVTGTALRLEDLQCEQLGYEILAAQNMQHISTLAILQQCLGEDRKFLDVSHNDERHLQAVQHSVASQMATFEETADKDLFLYPAWDLKVRHSVIELIMVASPVQCSIKTVPKDVYVIESADYQKPAYRDTLILETFTCICTPGFEEHNNHCRPIIPFAGTARGVATIVVTTIALVALAVLAWAYGKRRLKRAQFYGELQRGLLHDAQSEVLALKRAWDIEAHEISLLERIDGGSEGAFGAVWRGDWDGVIVAVKVLRVGLLELDSSLADEFDREAEFLMHARHANVVRFFGAGRMRGGEPFVVLELVSKGSLCGLLYGDHASVLDCALKQRLVLDVTRGMAYIHALGTLHRDLKSGNVLVTDSWRAKVADFGSMHYLLAEAAAGSGSSGRSAVRASSSSHYGSHSASTRFSADDRSLTAPAAPVGTPMYMAMEVLQDGAYGEAADVWAFGVMVWEVIEERAPDLLLETGASGKGPMLGRLLKVLQTGQRLQLAAGAPAWAQCIVPDCMLDDPSKRPSFVTLQERLEASEQ